MDHTLFTYRNLEELRKIQEEREVFTFTFVETKEMMREPIFMYFEYQFMVRCFVNQSE